MQDEINNIPLADDDPQGIVKYFLYFITTVKPIIVYVIKQAMIIQNIFNLV